MARPKYRVAGSVPIFSNSGIYIGRASEHEVTSLLKQGHHGCRRRGQLVKIIAKADAPLPATSHETPCSIPKKHMDINAGLIETSIGHERYVRSRVELFNPALSEVRAQAVKYVTRAELAAMQEPMSASLKRAIARGI